MDGNGMIGKSGLLESNWFLEVIKAVEPLFTDTISINGEHVGKIIKEIAYKFISLETSKILGPEKGPKIARLIVDTIAEILTLLAEQQHIIREEEPIDKIGYYMEMAGQHTAWKRREDFDLFQDYYDYLKQQIPDDTLDEEQLERNRKIDQIYGIGLLFNEINLQNKIHLPLEFLFDIGRANLTFEEVKCMLDVFQRFDLTDASIVDVMQGNMNFHEASMIWKTLETAFKESNIYGTQQENQERLDDIRSASRGSWEELLQNQLQLQGIVRLYERHMKEKMEEIYE